eukprot:2242421-Rhodomonas_salina.1
MRQGHAQLPGVPPSLPDASVLCELTGAGLDVGGQDPAQCRNSEGGYECVCAAGVAQASLLSCSQQDPCTRGVDNCHVCSSPAGFRSRARVRWGRTRD